MKKRLLILSVLLLMVCGQMWAGRSGSAGASGTYNGISYTLYSNYSYYCWWSDQSQYLGNVAVITECNNSTMVIPESLGGCNQIVIGEEALKSAVTSLTISKSVKLLEYCAVYYADKIQTLIIEDSDSPLYCGGTKNTYSYGAFSFIKNLKSVYIGRNLEYEHTESDHSYAPFRYCASGMHYNNESFDVTIGPNVTKIADYCFEYCGVKSLTVKRSLSQASQNNPIDWGKKAFENFDKFVTSNVPCYVSWTALDNFKNKSDYKTMFNYQLGVEPCRYEALEKIKQKREDTNYSDIKSELEAACADYETTIKNTNDINLMQLLMTRIFAVMELLKQKYDYPSDVAASIVSEYKAKIDNANIDNIEGERDNGKQALVDAKALQDAKTAAKNDLTEAKTTYPSDAADEIVSTYTGKINAATSTTDVTNEKEAGIKALKDAKDLQDAKAAAIAALNEAAKTYPSDAANGIVTTYTAKINTATSTTNVTKEKEAGIKALMDAKDLQDAKEAAIAALNEAAKTYPSDAADEIVSSYIGKINAATSTTDVTNEKEAGIKALKDAKDLQEEKADAITALNNEAGKEPSDAVKNILNGYTTKINAATSITDVETQKNNGIAAIQLQKKKETAIAALNAAKETYPSYMADEIISTYTDKINVATTTDAVTKEKEAGIKALMDAYNAQKEAERLAALDAVTVQQLADDDFSYLLEGEGVELTFDGDNVNMTVNGEDEMGFILSETDAITISPAHTFKLTAYQDSDHTSDYYTTFFTSEGAYKVPETSKAYAGTIENEEKTNVFKLTDIGNIIHVKEPVILRVKPGEVATGSMNITLMPSCNKDDASTENILEGTDEEKSLGANQYALSLGQSGVGFYLWDGEIIGANKAYMTLSGDDVAGIKAFTFQFDNGETTGINNVNVNSVNDNYFNLNGMRVDDNYKGIVIKNGKKVLRK